MHPSKSDPLRHSRENGGTSVAALERRINELEQLANCQSASSGSSSSASPRSRPSGTFYGFALDEGIFYGEAIPDLAFLQLGVRDVPALSFSTEPDVIRAGLGVAFAGFPFGSDGLLLRIDNQAPILVQATPFLRHGIVSSVHPFPCPNPHGFSIDAMSHGGASGSPIFRRDDPRVLGMLYAAFEGEHRLTYALPGHLLHWATNAALSDGTIDLSGIPSVHDFRATGSTLTAWHSVDRG